MPNRTITPPIHHAVAFDYVLPGIQQLTMPNGMPLYWYNGGSQEVLELCVAFNAGIWQEPAGGIATATGALLRNGTAKHSANEINELIEFYGASLKIAVQNDWSLLILHCLSKHLRHLLPILQELLENASFPQEEVALYQSNGLQRLQVQMKQCDFVANQKIDAMLYGAAHPYGRFTTPESYAHLTPEALRSFAERTYKTGEAKVFLSGWVGDEEVKWVSEFLGQQPRHAQGNTGLLERSPSTERTLQCINDPKGVQAAIRMGRDFPNRHHPDFAPMVLLNTLLGGYFGSRLMANIREEKGYTYGIYSMLAPNVQGGAMIIQSEVGRDVAEAALHEVYQEMERLCQTVVDDEELLLVKNYLLGNLLGDLDGPFQIMQRHRTLLLNGLDEQHFYNNIRIYKTATPETLQSLAQQYFRQDAFYEVTVV